MKILTITGLFFTDHHFWYFCEWFRWFWCARVLPKQPE